MRGDPFEADYVADLMRSHLGRTLRGYFRPLLLGRSNLPERGPVIFAPNHSGNAFPYDAMILDVTLWKHDGLEPTAKVRTTFEKELAATWWMNPFGIDNFWRRGGGVDATFDNIDRLLGRGDRVVYFPEGVPGIGKGFARRYRLQPFRTSFVRLAAKHGCPILPVYVVNGEWIMPFHFMLDPVDRMFRRFFHVPFLPLPGALLAIAWPWTWYLSLPARLVFKIGEPIDVAARVREAGIESPETADREPLERVAESIRLEMQEELDRLVGRFGRAPYRYGSLRRAFRRARGSRSALYPWAWPALWVRHDRDRRRPPARSRWHAWIRDLDLAAFYVPFGWPLLSLFRAFRKPPYGYRGLPRDEAREIRGNFRWNLSERPLPARPSADEPEPFSHAAAHAPPPSSRSASGARPEPR